MAFDGITIHALVDELRQNLINGRINKIAQPEKDELLLTIKASVNTKLLISVNPSLPLVYLTDNNKPSPLTAPNFCMLLRKHIGNGRIVDITQPGLERIIDIRIEHLDEMGDLCTKHLMIELMGKHSNIIFTDDNNRIIDSIKRINASMSSVREVLPGFDYFIPNSGDKLNPLTTTKEDIITSITNKALPVAKAIYLSFTGISPVVANELCHEADIDGDVSTAALSEDEIIHLSTLLYNLIDDIKNNIFHPSIISKDERPVEFFVTDCSLYDASYLISECESVSSMLENFYSEKNTVNRMKQKSAELRQIVSTLLDRSLKKLDIQRKQFKDTDKRDTYKIYGELINTYGYNVGEGASSLEALNYYTNETITIPLDPTLSARENSVKYFAKYNKLKRTYEALTELLTSTENEVKHLESILTSIDIATSNEDLSQIKEELIAYGFVKGKGNSKGNRATAKSKPLHYISSDGFHIYVGKNNLQNEELTFKVATGNDLWFHAKEMPGSHVIVKTEGRDIPDRTYEEAAALAAYYSSGRDYPKVEIDYIEKKHIKKVAGAAPGFVIYHTNYSMSIKPAILVKEDL